MSSRGTRERRSSVLGDLESVLEGAGSGLSSLLLVAGRTGGIEQALLEDIAAHAAGGGAVVLCGSRAGARLKFARWEPGLISCAGAHFLGESKAAPSERPYPSSENVFRCEGDYWTIAYAGYVMRLRDARGLRYLATLLRHPGKAFHARDLVASASSDSAAGVGQASRAARDGASRRRGRPDERARLAVTKSLGSLLDRISANHPPLGAHLKATVKRGYYCSYNPDPRLPTVWR